MGEMGETGDWKEHQVAAEPVGPNRSDVSKAAARSKNNRLPFWMLISQDFSMMSNTLPLR